MIRSTIPGTLTKGVADGGYGVAFELNQLLTVGDITNLYDMYRIDKIIYTFELVTPFLSNLPYPKVTIAPDWNNATAPLSEAEVLEYRDAKVFQFGPDKTIAEYEFAPRVAVQAYNTAVTSGYFMPETGVFVDTTYTGVDHYGLRFWISDYNTTISSIPVLRTYGVYHLSLRGTR